MVVADCAVAVTPVGALGLVTEGGGAGGGVGGGVGPGVGGGGVGGGVGPGVGGGGVGGGVTVAAVTGPTDSLRTKNVYPVRLTTTFIHDPTSSAVKASVLPVPRGGDISVLPRLHWKEMAPVPPRLVVFTDSVFPTCVVPVMLTVPVS